MRPCLIHGAPSHLALVCRHPRYERPGDCNQQGSMGAKEYNMKHRLVRACVGLFAAIGLIFAGLVLALPNAQASATATHQSASPASPFTASGCAGDTCMFLSTPSGGHVRIQAWPENSPGWHGHFHLTGPNGYSKNSPATTYSPSHRYTFKTVPATVGKWCVTGWSGTINEGEPCENIG